MSKTGFTLQAAEFSDSDNETPINGLINSYNRDYSLIYQEIKSFLKECKDNINKYIQLNQFGARFNMFALYAQMTSIETSTLTGVSDVSKQQLEHQKNLKLTYEKDFQAILERMENVIKDFLKFEIDFKRQYFGINLKYPEFSNSKKLKLKGIKSPVFGKLSRQESINSGSSAQRHASRSMLQQDAKKEDEQKETEIEQKLREILKRKLAPQKQNIIKFCDKESDPFRNMLKLEQKIDMMQSEIILSKTREEKIIEIFNKRRIQNIQPKGQSLIHSQLIETDSGHGGNLNKDANSKFKLQNDASQNQVKSNNKSLKKLQHFSKPTLKIEDEKMGDPNLISQNEKLTPRQLIQPKRIRSPTLRIGNGINFFCSPKNMISKRAENNKNLQVGFKKRREAQVTEELNRSREEMIEEEIQKMREKKKKKKQDLLRKQMQRNQELRKDQRGLDGGLMMDRRINKNREKFLMRRKSNNQTFHVGESSWVE